MTQEDKELLLKDLCARLPYGVKICYIYNEEECISTIEKIDIFGYIWDNYNGCYHVREIKPYLFPLSSMNEVQKHIYSIYINELKQSNGIYFEKALNSLQFWLYANHFDVNNLIPMGLANNAVGLNIY